MEKRGFLYKKINILRKINMKKPVLQWKYLKFNRKSTQTKLHWHKKSYTI